MSSVVPTLKLNNGYKIPAFGLGTYKPIEGVEESVKHAIDCNYRHIDTAYFYGNEIEIGNAVRAKIEEKGINREDMFIVSKLWSIFHEPDKVEYGCRMSLNKLNLEYIDLYLIHFPVSLAYVSDTELWPSDEKGIISDSVSFSIRDDIDVLDTYKAMEKLVEKGIVRSIGVSNFNIEQITRILEGCTIKPVVNQIEFSPGVNQKKLIEFCKDHDIVVVAYTPLGRPNLQTKTPDFIFDESVIAIGNKYKKTSAQVALRYLTQCGAIPIPRSQSKERIQENISIFDFELTPAEMTVLDQFQKDRSDFIDVQKLKEFSTQY
ncbi:Aldo-keto reductase family 1 member C23-like protein [Pseudolycoriella hygida]|uniref:Aldo-keto reductase family 1 member C23-like protein n=1 Tax=Pseudolycoriella hygida TaxID=35572 RepID=A0A9Q0N1A2_9DIPT|nr:Aldo-keto reductase family 1 member C23-like protein [Pseudolycoriella hygida]